MSSNGQWCVGFRTLSSKFQTLFYSELLWLCSVKELIMPTIMLTIPSLDPRPNSRVGSGVQTTQFLPTWDEADKLLTHRRLPPRLLVATLRFRESSDSLGARNPSSIETTGPDLSLSLSSEPELLLLPGLLSFSSMLAVLVSTILPLRVPHGLFPYSSALCFLPGCSYYAENYAGIMGSSLVMWTHSCVPFLQHLKWRRSKSGVKLSSNIYRSSSIISHSGAPLQEDTWENSKTSSWTVPTQRASHMMYTHIQVTTTQASTHMYTEPRPEQRGRLNVNAMMKLLFSRWWQGLWSTSVSMHRPKFGTLFSV